MELQDGEVIPKGNTTYSESDALPYSEPTAITPTEEIDDTAKRARYRNVLLNAVKDSPEVTKFNLKPKADTDIVTDNEIAGLQYLFADIYNNDKYKKGKLVGIPYKPLDISGDSSPLASINYELGDQIENKIVENNNKETLTQYNTGVTELNDPSLTIANSIDEVDPKKLSYVQYKKQRQSIPELPDVASPEDITPEHMAKLQVAMAAKTYNSLFDQLKDDPEVIASGYKPKKYDDIVSPKEEDFLEEKLKNKLNKEYAEKSKSTGIKFTPVEKLWDFNSGITDPIDSAINKKNEDEWLANTNKLAKQYGIAPFKSVEDYDQTHVAKWDAYNTKQLKKNNSTIAELNSKLPEKERFPIVKTNEEYQFIFPKLKAAAAKVQAAEVKKFEAKQVKEASKSVAEYNRATGSRYTLPKTKGEAKLVLEKINKEIKYKKSLEWTTETIPYEVTVAENKNGFYAESGRGNNVVVPKEMATKETRQLAAKKYQESLIATVQKKLDALNKTPEAKEVYKNLQALDNRFAAIPAPDKNLNKIVKTGQVYTVTTTDVPSLRTAPSPKEMATIAQDDKLRSKQYSDVLQKQYSDVNIAFEALNKNAQNFKISSDALKEKINKEGYTKENKSALNALDEQQKILMSQNDVLSEMGTLNKIYAGNIFESKAKVGTFAGASWNNFLTGGGELLNGIYGLSETLGFGGIMSLPTTPEFDDKLKKERVLEAKKIIDNLLGKAKANVSDEYMQKKSEDGSVVGVLMQLPRTIPAMAIAIAQPEIGFAMFALQDYGTRLPDAINNPKNANLTFNQLVATTLPISIVNGVIEDISMKSLGKSMEFLSLTKKAGSKIAAKELLSAKVYSNFLQEGVDATGLTKYVSTKAIKVAGALLEQANTEAFENLTQEIATNINNSIANRLLKTDSFQVNNDANAYWQSLKSGWIGGLAFGSIATAGYTIANNIKVESINNKQFQLVRYALQDPAIMKSWVTDIKLKIANKEITLDEGKAYLASVKEFGYIASKIPTDISVANQKKSFDLIKERMAIEQEVKGKDENLTLAKKQRITEINKQLQAISLEIVSAVDNGQVVTTNADGAVTTTPAKTIDGVGTYEFEGKLYVEDKDGNIKLEDGTSITDQKTIDKIKKEGIFNEIAPTAAQKVETLRAAEQAELDEKIPNADQYRVDGKVDRTKLTNDADIKAFDEVYAKYDKLITPLLEKEKAGSVDVVGDVDNITVSTKDKVFNKEEFVRDIDKLEKEKANGSRNIGLYSFKNKFVKVVKSKRNVSKEDVNRLRERVSDMDNVYPALEIIDLPNGSQAIVMDKASGKIGNELTQKEIDNIPQEHWDKFEQTIRELSKRGVQTDLTKRSNVLYDKDKGFQFIDLEGASIEGDSTNKFFKKDGKEYYYNFEKYTFFPKEYKSAKEIFTNIKQAAVEQFHKEVLKTRTVFGNLPVGIKASEGAPTSKVHAPLFTAAKTALKVLNKLFPNTEIHFHENNSDFQKVLDATANGKEASKTDGNFAYVKDSNGKYTVRIDINLANPKASVTTVIHEAGHPILLSAFGENPDYFKYLKSQVAKSVGFTKNAKLKEFIKAYDDAEQPEEYLVQLGGILKEGEKIEPNVFRRIAEAINKIFLKITDGKFKPFENVKNSNDAVRYFASLVDAIRNGDLGDIKLSSQSQKSGATEMGSKQSRGGLTATDMKSMTVADNGDLLFFHYGDIKGSKIDARKGTPKAYTTDKRVYTANYYYTNESDREGMVGGKVNVVRVPADKVYSFNKDVLGLFDEAKKNSEAHSKGQAFSPNRQADFIAQLAAKNGFDMVVAKWGNGYRAESPKALTIDAALTKQMRTNGSLSTAAVDEKLNQDIYNAAASKANGNSEKYRSAFYGIKDITAKDIMEHPILSRGIPKKLADKYNAGEIKSKQSRSNEDNLISTNIFIGRDNSISEISDSYKRKNNLSINTPNMTFAVSDKDGKRIADAYDQMKHSPNDPSVKKGFADLITQIKSQADALMSKGYKFQIANEGEGYNSNSKAMVDDVRKTKRIFIDPSSKSFGTDRTFDKENIGLQDSGYKDANGIPMTNVELIRGVHDLFGHNEFGNGFGATGEENAWRNHMSMFTGLAQKALTATTRGQNSWVNFAKHMRNSDGSIKKKGDKGYLSANERPFAEQKIGFLPDWATENSYGDVVTIEGKSVKPVNKYVVEGSEVYEIDDASAFYTAMKNAKESDTLAGIQVELKPVEKIQEIIDKGGRLLITKDGKVGMMVYADGNAGGGFKNTSAEGKNLLKPLLLTSIKLGARYADAYDTFLPEYYSKFGFKPYKRIKFNPEYAEAGWENTILKSKPDIVVLYWDGGSRENIGKNYGKFPEYNKSDGEYTDDYEGAIKEARNISIAKEPTASLIPSKEVIKSKQSKTNNALKDVESTAKALEGLDKSKIEEIYAGQLADNLSDEQFPSYEEYLSSWNTLNKERGFDNKLLSEAYHKAKADGSNPELVQAVEELLSDKSKVYRILNDTFNQEAKKTKIDKLDVKALARKVVDIVKSSKLYEQTDDIERENAIIDFLKTKGIVQKRVIEPRNKNIISVNEVTALKDQIRLEIKAANDGAKSIEDAVKKIGEIIKGLAKGKKISVTSAKALINKFSNMNTANKDSVNSVLDYATKIFNDAEYADKVSQVRALNAAMKRAARNSAIPPATRSIALSFAKINPEAVSDIDAHLEAANKIKDATLGVKENGVRIRKAIDANAMADYLNRVMAEQETYDANNPTTTRVVEPLDEERALEYLASEHDSLLQAAKALVPSAVLTDAEMAQLKNFLKLSIDDFETMAEKVAAVEALDHFVKNADMGKIPFILNTQQVNANINKGVKAIMPKLTSVSLMWFSEQKAKLRGWFDNKTWYRDSPKDFSKTLAYFMSQSIRRIDNLIGNFKNNDVFNNTFKALASGYAKYLFKINSMDADVIFQKVLTSFNGNMYKAVQHCYKMTMYKLQLEYESNTGNTEVIPAMKHLEKTLDSGNLTNKDKAELRRLIEEFSTTDATTGEKKIDTAKIWDSFSDAEKNAAEMLASYYEKLRPYAQHVAVSLRDVAFNPRANYMMLNVINQEESLSDAAPSELKAKFIKGSTKAGTINARDGNPHPISLDPYNTFNVANRDIMMDYCLLNPIKTVEAIFNKLVEDTADDEKANDVAKSLQFVFNEITKSIIGRSVVMSDKVWTDVFNFIKKVGARYMLAKIDKAPAEFAGNAIFAGIAYTENILEGIKNNAYQRNFELSQAMEALDSYSIDRLYPHKGQSGAFLDPNSFDIDVRDKKHFIDGASNVAQVVYYNSLLQAQKGGEAVSDFLVTAPDLAVGRMAWEGTLRLEFKKETGTEIDLEKIIKKDYDYLERYKDALEKATTEADRVIVDIASSKNPFVGMAKESVRRDYNSFMTSIDGFLRSFSKNENQVGMDAAYALIKSGKIDRARGVRLLAAILARGGVYNSVRAKVLLLLTGLGFAIVNGITGGDDSEEKRRRRARLQLDYMNIEGDDWAEKSQVTAGKKIISAGNIYEVVTGGVTSTNPPSDTSGKIITDGTAKYKWVSTIPRIQGSITGIKDNVSMGTSLRTYDKEFIEKATKAAAPEETMSHSFNKGAAQSAVGIILGRNSGAIFSNLFMAPAVEYANEKFIHPAISSDPYNKYRDGIMYSKMIDRTRKDPELNFIIDNTGVFNPFFKAAVTGYRMFDNKYGDRLREVNKKIENHEKGVKVPREESSQSKYYELLNERDALLEKQKPVKAMMAKNIIIAAFTVTGVLPSGKTIDAIADKTLQDKILSPSDMDNIIKNIENARNYSGGEPVRLENPKDNDKVLVYPDIYTNYTLQGRKIPAKKP